MIGLQINSLSKKYSEELFSDINISVASPARIGLIGDNGCGKSTLLKILAGLDTPNSGTIQWTGKPHIGYLEQEIVDDEYNVSGGEKKILKLTELFYGDYDVLLLDEPDNHLDEDHKLWFEQLVKDFIGLVIVISHDRHFLETAIDQTWHMEEKKLSQYKFNYLKFKDIYEQNIQTRQHAWVTQEKERLRLDDLVKRMRELARTNDKFSGRLHNAEKRYERWVDGMVEKPPVQKTVKMNVDVNSDNLHKSAIYLKAITKDYGKGLVLTDVNLHIKCGEKVAIVAPNGSGKSTLLNIIAGRLAPSTGEVTIGPNLRLGYYTQEHLDALDEHATGIEELQKSAEFFHYEGIAYLKKFLFSEAQILSETRLLSGGQKSRLQLAKFLAKNPEILVLDEPTNHMDLRTVLALENFLVSYQGTLVLVSHDKELVDRVVDRRYLLKGGTLKKLV